MATYIVLSRFKPEGLKEVRGNPELIHDIAQLAERQDGKVVAQYGLLGKHDLATVVSLPDNEAAMRYVVDGMAHAGLTTQVLSAMDVAIFTRLLGQTTETTGPYRWQISWWARLLRRALRPREVTRHVAEACQPLTVEGRDQFDGLGGPCIIIGNHASHLDALVVIEAVPARVRERLAFGSAADRWFLKGRPWRKSGWWNSLTLNCFPIKRGGGSSTLDYAKWLLDRGWNVMIFPEGTRSTTGKLSKFRHGVSLLALDRGVPVVPLYMDGLREIRPKGSQQIVPGPVRVRIGAPVRFEPGTPVPEATRQLYEAMEGLRLALRAERSGRRETAGGAVAAAGGGGL
jgi:1-acyl-sn-glycerol-3-phosphate acyltransferase